MSDLAIYRTPVSLLISFSKIENIESIFSGSKFSLSVESIKTRITTTIKLVVFNGKLYVSTTETSETMAGNMERVHHSERMSARLPGLIARYIHPASMDAINSFLDENYPKAVIKSLNKDEEYSLEELRSEKNDESLEIKRKLAELVVKIQSLSFPILSTLMHNRLTDGFYAFYRLETGAYPYYRTDDYKEFLRGVFGVYRKDLAKTVVKCNDTAVLWASKFRDVIDVDAIIVALQKHPSRSGDDIIVVDALRNFPRNTIKRLLEEGLATQVDSILVEDALSMSSFIPHEQKKTIRSWKELHDYGMMHYRHNQEVKEISYPAEFERFFESADFGKRKVVPLRNSTSFIDTGKIMDVCVGSIEYIARAFDGEGHCFRIDEENEPYALVEVIHHEDNSWQLRQLYGVSNSPVSEEFRTTLMNELAKFINTTTKGKIR